MKKEKLTKLQKETLSVIKELGDVDGKGPRLIDVTNETGKNRENIRQFMRALEDKRMIQRTQFEEVEWTKKTHRPIRFFLTGDGKDSLKK